MASTCAFASSLEESVFARQGVDLSQSEMRWIGHEGTLY